MSATENDLKAVRAELDNLRKDFARLAETLEKTARHGGEEALSRHAARPIGCATKRRRPSTA